MKNWGDVKWGNQSGGVRSEVCMRKLGVCVLYVYVRTKGMK